MEHKRTLNLNKHHSCLLQEDWNRYSEKSFEHTILGEYSLDDIDYHERNFITELKSNNPEYGYNLCDGGNKNKTHHKNNKGATKATSTIKSQMARKKTTQIMAVACGTTKEENTILN